LDEPSTSADRLRAEAEADLSRIIDGIVALTGLPTRWRGIVVVRGPDFGPSGQKHGWCGISLREDVLAVPESRWTTMIHEGLHSVSAAFSSNRLDLTNSRWEEAIVEQTQRLLRNDVLEALQVELDEAALAALDDSHRYNEYIRALEVQRAGSGKGAREFYLQLLGLPPYERARILVTVTRALASRREEDQ